MWEEKDNTLYRKFVFNNFIEAFAFMTKVAILAYLEKHLEYCRDLAFNP
jgi:4a-hydroxytetrahydrobiopterin dehydratase